MTSTVAFLIPHEEGCMDTATGATYQSVESVKESVDHVVFNLTGDPQP